MYCKFCGREVDEKAETCVHCGKPLRTSFLEHSEFTRLKVPREPKSPGLAGFLGFVLSWLFMGPVGYIYLGQWNWFFLSVVIYTLVLILSVGFAWAVFPFIFAFHQYDMARQLNTMLASSRQPNSEGAAGVQPGGTSPV